jgi:hypothetical protein
VVKRGFFATCALIGLVACGAPKQQSASIHVSPPASVSSAAANGVVDSVLPSPVTSPVGTATTSPTGSTPPQFEARYAGPITAPRSADVSLAVPTAADDHPKISWSQALSTCGDAQCDPLPDVGTIELALATSPNTGTMRADGSIAPLMHDTLVYVMSWSGAICAESGPAPSGGSGPVRTETCTLLNFVDATTGAVLYSESG